MSAGRRVAGVRAPDEASAQERAWELVRGAYAERMPVPRRARRARILLVPAIAALLAGVALTPAGATVGRWIRHALAQRGAAPALLSLPAPGHVLVSGSEGAWIVAADGSKRRLGSWSQASFSPNGLYVAVAGGSTLAAVNPLGTAQWTLSRAAVSDPRWYPPSGFWVAYLSGSALRVAWGDGLRDHQLAAGVDHVAPAWRPGIAYQLAYVAGSGAVIVRDAQTGGVAWRAAARGPRPIDLAWSSDGERLLVLFRTGARVYDGRGAPVSRIALPRGVPALSGALSPDGRALALIRGGAGDAVLYRLPRGERTPATPSPTRILSGSGLGQVTFSPNGRWLLVTWPATDEWIFVRTSGGHGRRLLAVPRIAEQFDPGRRPHGSPQLDGWCCTRSGAPAGTG